MKISSRRVVSGSFVRLIRTVTDSKGKVHDFRSKGWIYPQKHHVIITTEDGYKLALNAYNDIAYRIVGEKY